MIPGGFLIKGGYTCPHCGDYCYAVKGEEAHCVNCGADARR